MAVHPGALMSMQPSFHRCSRPRKKVCPSSRFSLLSACLACESGKVCRESPGLPGATPRFSFLSGTEWMAISLSRSWGLAVVRNGRILSFGFGHFLALPAAPFYYLDSLCCSLTQQATQRRRDDRLPVSALKKRPKLDIKTPF